MAGQIVVVPPLSNGPIALPNKRPADGDFYETRAALAAAKPVGNSVWVGGRLYEVLPVGQASDVSVVTSRNGKRWIYAEDEVHGDHFDVKPFDGVTCSADALRFASQVATAQQKVLRLDMATCGISKPWDYAAQPFPSAVRVQGACEIWLNANFSGQRPFTGGGTSIVGDLSEVFNNISGNDPRVTLRPVATLAEDALLGAKVIKPAPPVGKTVTDLYSPGYLCWLMSQRLCGGEHRNYMVKGELALCVEADNAAGVTLSTTLNNPYSSAAVLHTTTVAASPAPTNKSVALTAAPPADVIASIGGMQMKIGASTTRYIQTYDEANKVPAYFTGGEWDQLGMSPVPSAGDTVTINARTFLFAARPILFQWDGVSFNHSLINLASGTGQNGWRGPSVSYLAPGSYIKNSRVKGAVKMGWTVNNSIGVVVEGSVEDANDPELGYGYMFSECRDCTLRNFTTDNCRRGTDSSGRFQVWGLDVHSFRISGGYKTSTGVPWEGPENLETNYGGGGHGQMWGATFHNGRVSGCKVGFVDRGGLNRFYDIDCDEMMEVGVLKGAGGDLWVDNIRCDWLQRPENFGGTLNVGGDNKSVVRLQISDRYVLEPSFRLTFGENMFRGFTTMVDILVNAIKENSTWSNWVIVGNRGSLQTGADAYLINARRPINADKWSIYDNVVDVEGQAADKRLIFSTGLVLKNSWMRRGPNVFRVAADDDKMVAVKLPFPGSANLKVTISDFSGDAFYGSGIITENSDGPGGAHGFTRDLSGGAGSNIRQYAGPLGDGGGADGFINIAYVAGRREVEISNRLGSAVNIIFEVYPVG